MTSAAYRVTRLRPGFDVGAFDCGEETYNSWLRDHAAGAVAAGSAAVYLLLEKAQPHNGERVVGYFAICPTLVVRDKIPRPLRGGVLRAAPGWLLAKLALDMSVRADGESRWGAQLLREALEVIVQSADQGGGQIIVVDADNAGLVDWYKRHGFRSTDDRDLRLYMKVATARRYLLGDQTASRSGASATLGGHLMREPPLEAKYDEVVGPA